MFFFSFYGLVLIIDVFFFFFLIFEIDMVLDQSFDVSTNFSPFVFYVSVYG